MLNRVGNASQTAFSSLNFVWPQDIFWLWCFCVGLAATVSHMAMTYALKFAPSSTLAPLHYLEIVPAALFSYLVFGDFPTALTWCGIAVIIGSGLYVIHRERVSARQGRVADLEVFVLAVHAAVNHRQPVVSPRLIEQLAAEMQRPRRRAGGERHGAHHRFGPDAQLISRLIASPSWTRGGG